MTLPIDWYHPNFSRNMSQEYIVDDCRIQLHRFGAAAYNCPCHPSSRVENFNSITNRMEIAPRCFCVELQESRVPCLLMEFHSHRRHLLSYAHNILEEVLGVRPRAREETNTEEVRESLQHPSVQDYPTYLFSLSDSPVQAVGVATNWQMARRAGMLMMAATIVATARPELGQMQHVEMPVLSAQPGIPNPTRDLAFQRLVIMTAVMLRVEGNFMFSLVHSIAASGSAQPLLVHNSVPASAASEASGPFQPPPPRAENTTQLVVALSEDTDMTSQSMSPWT